MNCLLKGYDASGRGGRQLGQSVGDFFKSVRPRWQYYSTVEVWNESVYCLKSGSPRKGHSKRIYSGGESAKGLASPPDLNKYLGT